MRLFPRHWSPVESSWRSHSRVDGGAGDLSPVELGHSQAAQSSAGWKASISMNMKLCLCMLIMCTNKLRWTPSYTHININTKMRLWGLGYYESGPDVQVFADSEVLIIFTCATERLLPLCMHCTHTPLSSRGQMHSFCLNFIADFSLICSPLPFLSGPVVIGLLLHTPSVSENEMSRMH